MLKTVDEILIKYAAIIGDDDFPVPAPKPPTKEELEFADPEDVVEISEPSEKTLPLPIPLPEESKPPLSVREKEEIEEDVGPQPAPGSLEELADKNPALLLRGVYKPYDRFYGIINARKDKDALMQKAIKKLLRVWPETYFDVQLYKLNKYKYLALPALRSWMKKDPFGPLQAEVWDLADVVPALGELWHAVINKAINQSLERNPKHPGLLLDDAARRQLRSLTHYIAKYDPEFYVTYIKGKPLTEKETKVKDDDIGITNKVMQEKAQRGYEEKFKHDVPELLKEQLERGLITEEDIPRKLK